MDVEVANVTEWAPFDGSVNQTSQMKTQVRLSQACVSSVAHKHRLSREHSAVGIKSLKTSQSQCVVVGRSYVSLETLPAPERARPASLITASRADTSKKSTPPRVKTIAVP